MGRDVEPVSEIAYIIPHWAFSSWIALVGILLMPDLMEHLPEQWQFIGFLSIVGLLCVAATSYYRTEAAPLHYIGGIMCACLAVVVMAMIQPALPTIGCSLYVFFMAVCRWEKWCFWGEVVIFLMLILALNI